MLLAPKKLLLILARLLFFHVTGHQCFYSRSDIEVGIQSTQNCISYHSCKIILQFAFRQTPLVYLVKVMNEKPKWDAIEVRPTGVPGEEPTN